VVQPPTTGAGGGRRSGRNGAARATSPGASCWRARQDFSRLGRRSTRSGISGLLRWPRSRANPGRGRLRAVRSGADGLSGRSAGSISPCYTTLDWYWQALFCRVRQKTAGGPCIQLFASPSPRRGPRLDRMTTRGTGRVRDLPAGRPMGYGGSGPPPLTSILWHEMPGGNFDSEIWPCSLQ